MNQYEVSVSRVIDAPPAAVYAVFADYHHAHAAVLPKPYFTGMTVEKGGTGAGTEVAVHMSVLGTKVTYHFVVTGARASGRRQGCRCGNLVHDGPGE